MLVLAQMTPSIAHGKSSFLGRAGGGSFSEALVLMTLLALTNAVRQAPCCLPPWGFAWSFSHDQIGISTSLTSEPTEPFLKNPHSHNGNTKIPKAFEAQSLYWKVPQVQGWMEPILPSWAPELRGDDGCRAGPAAPSPRRPRPSASGATGSDNGHVRGFWVSARKVTALIPDPE